MSDTSVIPNTTAIERGTAVAKEATIIIATAHNNTAARINRAVELFWGQPDEQLMATLNSDPLFYVNLMTEAALDAAHVNERLRKANGSLLAAGYPVRFTAVAPTSSPRPDISFDASTGQWVLADPEAETEG